VEGAALGGGAAAPATGVGGTPDSGVAGAAWPHALALVPKAVHNTPSASMRMRISRGWAL
jgi:hypothetical protein